MIRTKWIVEFRNKLVDLAYEPLSAAAGSTLMTQEERDYIGGALKELVKYVDDKIRVKR